jgi:hypothetical protein
MSSDNDYPLFLEGGALMGGIFKVIQVIGPMKDGFYQVTFEPNDYASRTGFTFTTQLDVFKVGDKYALNPVVPT